MTPLPTEFRKHGDLFRQVRRDGRVAMFERIREATESTPPRVWFEVIIVQSHNGREIGGQTIPPAEFFPSTSSWGDLAWTFQGHERERAETRYRELLVRFGIVKAGPTRRRTPPVLQTLQTSEP